LVEEFLSSVFIIGAPLTIFSEYMKPVVTSRLSQMAASGS